MADYYALLSMRIEVSDEAQLTWLLDAFRAVDDNANDEDGRGALPEEIVAVATEQGADLNWGTGVLVSKGPLSLWIRSDESVQVEALATIIQSYLRRFDIQEGVGFEYAFTCSRPRLDAYGGGACYVTQKGLRWMTTGRWLGEQEESDG